MNLFDKIVKLSQHQDIAHFQNIGGAIAMGLSCLAFTGSVLFNDSIPSEQKKFLVPQELADGVINVSLFLFMTDSFKKGAEKAIENGEIFPKKFKEDIEKVKKQIGENANWEAIKKNLPTKMVDDIDHFHMGYKNTISLGGSLLAASIITPIVRNIVASKIQKKAISKTTIKTEEIILPPKTSQPYQKTFVQPQAFQGKIGMRI